MRLLIFTDVPGETSTRLVLATLRLSRARADLEVCGIVTSRPERFHAGVLGKAGRIARALLLSAVNRDLPLPTTLPPALDLARLQRVEKIPLLVPPRGDPNHPEFIEWLRCELRPQVALSYQCLSVFRRPLLSAFEQAVNYHAGLLPQYRGVMATSFSVLAGEERSGFTFHRMTARIDAGPILEEGSVPVGGASAAEVDRRKLDLAVAALPRVLEKVVAQEPGRLPEPGGHLHTTSQAAAWTGIENPADVTAAQLDRRLRAFGTVHLTIGGAAYPVTRLRAAVPGQRLAFRTADGRWVAPDRFDGLPHVLYRFGRRLP